MNKIITVEEHFEFPSAAPEPDANTKVNAKGTDPNQVTTLLTNFDQRLAYMDRYGITTQVLSNAGHSPQLISDKDQAIAACQDSNDRLAQQISLHPDRFGGLAALPMINPDAAAAELERAITKLGLNGALIAGAPFDHFLDEPQYRPVFAEAEKLDVPLYLHPGLPRKEERDMLFKSPAYSDALGDMLSMAGWGWHMEQGIQMVRLISAGLFDRYPHLHLVSGHWGEFVPTFLERLDEFIGMVHTPLDRKFSEYYRENVYVTASGMFTKPQMDLVLAEMGPSHVLWAEDFPFLQRKDQVAGFLDAADLSAAAKDQIAATNSELLFKLNR